MKVFYIAMSVAGFLLTSACGGVNVESVGTVAPLSVATTPISGSSSIQATTVSDRSRSPQQRECLHCAP